MSVAKQLQSGISAKNRDEEAMARVMEALGKLGDDPGAIFEQGILEIIFTIRQKSPANWQRIRASAKKARVSIAELDKLTQQDKEEANNSFFPTVEPWDEQVDGAALVRELSDTLRQYVICEPVVADAAALWIVFTWFINEVHVAPIANITAPLPNCGKSTLLDFMELFAFQPLKCDGISSSALFRSMDKWQPSLLIDEVDTFLRDNEDARGVLNSGHKRNGSIIRVVGESHEPTRFSTWGAKALCGIGSIASTLESRSIRFELRRKLPSESVDNIRFMETGLEVRLKRQLCRLHDDVADEVIVARPDPVLGLNNRAQDNWEPLLQIADIIGGEWPERARVIAIIITRMDEAEQAPDVGTELLKDIKAIFENKNAERIFSAELVDTLCADGEALWNTWNRGKPITARQVSTKLAGFSVKSKDVRIGTTVRKGYIKSDFLDAFKRYLSAGTSDSSATPLQAGRHAGCRASLSATTSVVVADEGRPNVSSRAGCSAVADGNAYASAKYGSDGF